MNMNELQYIDQTFDDFAFLDNIQVSQIGEIFEEKPALCSSITQNTSTSPPCSSPSVISFSNSNSSSATPTTTNAQNYFKNLNTSSLKTEVPSGTTINFSSSNTSSDSDYDDSKQLFQAMGFGAGQSKKMNYSRTPLQAQDHVLAERKRRERLTQYFVTLSTLIPNLKKVLLLFLNLFSHARPFLEVSLPQIRQNKEQNLYMIVINNKLLVMSVHLI